MKTSLRNKAFTLRKSGMTYSEILKKIPVAKSTLSPWLRSTGLSKRQKQRLTKNELFLMGIALYWAEGAKEKSYRKSSQVSFANSDPLMIKLFLKWLYEIIKIEKDEIILRLAFHENNKHREKEIIKYWAGKTDFPFTHFTRILYKTHKPKTNRKNTKDLYFGLLEVNVKKSSDLNRKISGWIRAINNLYWGVV